MANEVSTNMIAVGDTANDGAMLNAAVSPSANNMLTKDEEATALAASSEDKNETVKDEAAGTTEIDTGGVQYMKQLSKREIVHEQYSQKSLLISSVFAVLCFFPLGLVALYFGIKVKDTQVLLKRKDYAKKSYFWSVAAITTGTIALFLILLVLILGISGVIQ